MSLSNNQARFFELVQQSNCADTIMAFFDIEARQIKLEQVESGMTPLSHGEQIMLMFFTNLWLNRNHFPFSMIDAAQTLDQHNRELISDWLAEPFWP